MKNDPRRVTGGRSCWPMQGDRGGQRIEVATMVARPQTTAAEVRDQLACGRSGCACSRPGELTHCPVPSHGQGRGDRSPSLSVTDGISEPIVNCHGGCDWREVKAAIGLGAPARLPERLAPPAPRALFRDPGAEPDPGPPEADVAALVARGQPIAGTPAESYLRARGSWDLDGAAPPGGCRWFPREVLPWSPPAGAVGAIGYVHARPEPGNLVPVGVQLEGLDAHGERTPDGNGSRWRRCYGTKAVHVVHDPAPYPRGPVVVVAEGELTAQALAALGVGQVALATGGRSGLAPETMRPILATLTGGRGLVVLSPDGDATGREAMRRLEVALLADGYTVRADTADAWERTDGRDALDEAVDALAAGATWEDLWRRRATINADIAREVEAAAAAGADRSRQDNAPAIALAALLPGELLTDEPAQPPAPALLQNDAGGMILPVGRYAWVHGDKETAKSWIGVLACIATIRTGSAAVYIGPEMSRRDLQDRVRLLGAAGDVLTSARFLRADASDLTPEKVEVVASWLRAVAGVPIVVIDSATSTGAPRDGAALTAWADALVNPFRGWCTVLVIAHQPHAQGDGAPRDRPLGTVQGSTDPDVLIGVRGEPWTRTRPGHVTIRLTKSRHSDHDPFKRGDDIAVMRGDWTGGAFALRVEEPEGGYGVDTDIAGPLLAFLRERGAEQSQKALEDAVHGSRDAIREVARAMCRDGRLTRRNGPRGAILYGLPEWVADGADLTTSPGELMPPE